MKARSLSHIGITVSDFNTAVKFYADVFGCPLVGVSDAPPDRVRSFFGVDGPAPACKIGWVRTPGGGILEIFAFEPKLPRETTIPWNRTGITHYSFNVRNCQKWYDYLQSKGVECLSKPEQSPRGHWFFFAKDMDGNLIEMIDLKGMHWILQWGGALGGLLFRRGRYKQYYE